MTEIHSLNGHRWIRLATRSEIDAEADAMGIEIERDGWMTNLTDEDPTRDGVWSLRTPDGSRVVTAEIRQSWDSYYDEDDCDDVPFVDGAIVEQVRAIGGRAVDADEVLHVATLRAWFREQGVTLQPTVWRDAGTVVEKWTTRSRDHADTHVKTLYVDETGARIFEVKDERVHPMIIRTTSPLTSVDGLSSGSVAIVTLMDGKPGLQMLKGDKWETVEVRDGVRIGVMGSTVEATPGRLVVLPPRYREVRFGGNRSFAPRMVNVAVDYVEGSGPGIYRPVVVGQDFRGLVTGWEKADG
jgi:hypothetical protein